VFTSPPREKPAKGQETYGPIADYLTQALGQKVLYRHPKNWLNYMNQLQDNAYDLVFDGPHFVSWRQAKFKHTPLVKLPGSLDFVIIVRADNERITELADLGGRSICGHAPPNLATLTLQAQFTNPTRQPFIKEVRGFGNIFKGVVSGKCVGAAIPTKVHRKLNKDKNKGVTRILFQSKPLPHQAISASTRVPADVQTRIAAALLAPEAESSTKALRARFAGGKSFLPATPEEYQGLGYLLKDIWGFEL
jgi:ABC-type phosphate/phosphonate transport system substrate-binding protein